MPIHDWTRVDAGTFHHTKPKYGSVKVSEPTLSSSLCFFPLCSLCLCGSLLFCFVVYSPDDGRSRE
jgi:hypothetical protein